MFKLLKHRGVLFLSLSNTISQFGDRLTYMVIVTLIGVMAPGRISAFSEFSATFTLPVIILSPFVGVVIDHGNKKLIMFRCHLIQSVLIFITPAFIFFTHSLTPVWFLIVLFYSLEVFNNTSRNSVVPELVEYNDLVPANSVIITLSRIATFVGMVGGGYLISVLGWRLGFYADATTHFIAGALALGMGANILFEPEKKLGFSITKEIKKSLRLFGDDINKLLKLLMKDRVVIFVMLSVFVLPFTAATAHTVLVFMVQQQFNLGTAGVGIFGGIIGLGMLLGALLMGYFGKKFCRSKIILYNLTILTVFFLLGPFFPNVIVLYLIAFVSGVVFSFIGIAQDTMLQEDVIKGIRGRIFATKEFIINLTFLISAIIFGIIAKSIAPYTIIRMAGVVLLLILIIALIVYRKIPDELRSRL